MEDIDYDDLDSGIRETVRWLRGAGFDTRDSGDGVSKFSNGYGKPGEPPITDREALLECGVQDVPHVMIVTPKDGLVREAERLLRLLRARAIRVVPVGYGEEGEEVSIQAMFDPAGNLDPAGEVAVLALFGLSDALLASGVSLPDPPGDVVDAFYHASTTGFLIDRLRGHPYVEALDEVGDDRLTRWLAAHAGTTALGDHAVAAAVTVSLASRGVPLPDDIPNQEWMGLIWKDCAARTE